jgi:mannosyltransferase
VPGSGRTRPFSDVTPTYLMPNRRLLLVCLLLLAFGLHLHEIDRESLWRDEVDSLRFAAETWEQLGASESLLDAGRQMARYLTQPGENGPLYFVGLELWLRAAGRSELALRFSSAAAALVAVALVYSVGRRISGRRETGALAALLAAVNPYLAWYAGEGKMYALVTMLALLSTYLLVRALAQGRNSLWAGYVVVTTTLFYVHILTPLILPVQALLALCLYPRAALSKGAVLAAAALTLPYLPLIVWQLPHLLEPAETGFPFVPLVQMAQRQSEAFSRGIIGWPATVALVLWLGAAGLGLVLAVQAAGRSWQTGDLRITVGLAGWALVPLVALYLVSTRRPLFTERYLIWTLPAWWLFIAGAIVGLAREGRTGRWLATAWIAGLAITGLLGIGHQWHTPVRADFRTAAATVAREYEQGELVLFQIPYLQTTFDYYAAGLDYEAAEGPYTNYGNPPEETADYLKGITTGHRRVWLILSEAPMWDQRGLTITWFEQNGRLVDETVLNRVTVGCWELSEH